MFLTSLAVSALFILLTCVLAAAGRLLVKKAVHNDFLRLLFEEGIAAAELCGCCFELIVVADNFGVSMYAIFLFMLTIYWSQVWGDATACPYTHLEDLIGGRTDLRTAALKSWAELTGGILVYRYVQLYWSLEIVDTHVGKAYEECSADLKVPMVYGAVVEGIATCMCRIASKALSEMNPSFGPAIDSFIGTSLVVAAFDYSGGYFNPVLATSLKFGCTGNSFVEHIVVYWVGACGGAIASVYIYNHPGFKNLLFGDQHKEVLGKTE